MAILSVSEINLKLDKAFNEVVDWVNDQSEEQLNEVRMEGKWTAAGHVFHLLKTTKAIGSAYNVSKIALRLKFGKNKREERTYEELEEVFTTLSSKTKFVSKESLAPAHGRQFEKEEILMRFRYEQKKFKESLLNWDEKKLSNYLLPHPVVGKLTLREYAYFNVMHTYHHLGILKTQYS